MNSKVELMSSLERDVLQEVMNIAFGQAAADLSEVINVYVTLTVPCIDLLDCSEILPVIARDISDQRDMSMIKQFFSGRFSGSSVLILPHGEGRKLLKVFDEYAGVAGDGLHDMDTLERETLIEISNIIMGACISKIAQLLGDVVSYSPPRYYSSDHILKTLEESFGSKDSFAVFFKTIFHFQDFDASGFLFVICEPETLEWLKKAIEAYLQQYE